MDHVRYYLDWLFKDYGGGRRSKYVIAEAPNKQLIIFMVAIVMAVIVYPGFWQKLFAFTAYIALTWWGISEARSGRSRFRRFLGYSGIIAVISALLLKLGF